MAVIGWDSEGANTDTANLNWTHEGYVSASGKTHVAVAGESVTELAVFGDGTGQCIVAIYEVEDGLPGTFVDSGIVSIGSSPDWYRTTVDIPLTDGIEYTACIDYWVDEAWNIRYQDLGGTQQSVGTLHNLPTTWVSASEHSFAVSYYATVTGSVPPEGSVSGAVGWVGSVDGVAPEIGANSGEVSGAVSWVGTITGAIDPQGEVSGAVSWVGSVLSYSGRWPTSISGRQLLDQNGDVYPAFVMSSWALADLSDEEITTALESVAANGFNGLVVFAGGGYQTDASWDPKYERKANGDNWWSGTPWASSLGPAWSALDWIADEALRLGMVLHISFAGGYDTTGARADWVAVTNAQMRQVGIDVANRYLVYPNIVWHVMFDYTDTVAGASGQRINALFDGINDTEGVETRPIRWCEVNQGNSTFAQGWLDPTGSGTDTRFSINCMYWYFGDSVDKFEETWAESSGPTGDCEPLYVGHDYPTGNSDQQYRERVYSVFIEGGSLINVGHEDWWTAGKTGVGYTDGETFETVQTDTEIVEVSYAIALLNQYIKDLTYGPTSSFVTTGQGTGDTKAAQGNSDTAALAYFPDSRTVVVDTTILSGVDDVRLRWYDPTSGDYTVITESEAQQSGRSISYPSAHAGGTNDWVLVVDASQVAEGSVDGSIDWVGSVNGQALHVGSVAGNISWAGVVVGGNLGVVLGAIGWAGSVSGAKSPQGDVSGEIDWAGTIEGVTPAVGASEGTVDGAISWVGSVSGVKPAQGSVSGSISWAGIIVGGNLGVVLGSIGWEGTVSGVKEPQGSVSGEVEWAGTIDGETPTVGVNDGSVNGTITWSGSVSGVRQPVGSVSGAIGWSGVVVGGNLGVVIGAVMWSGSVQGSAPVIDGSEGSVNGTISWVGSVLGSTQKRGGVVGAIAWVGVVTALYTIDPAVFLLRPHSRGYKPIIPKGRG